MFIDTHCHLSKEDYDDVNKVIKEARDNKVNKIIISGCTKDAIIESVDVSQSHKDVFLTIGYHPSEATEVTEEDLNLLEEQIVKYNVVGIGEIGLDYHYGVDNTEKQKNLFRRQMSLAKKYKLPVVIHSRDATADTISILKEFPDVVGDIHCFSGSAETANIYISLGYKIGIGGVVTFKNSNLYKVVEAIGIDNILLETDSPYLSPEPFRGEKNSSKNIPLIAQKIAEICGVSIEKVASETTENACVMFDL